jgi:hypothetical protein
LRILVGVLATAALVAGGLTIVAVTQAGRAADQSLRAEGQARIASARELSAAAVASLPTDAERGMLLAMEAIAQTRDVDGTVLPEAEEALHRAVTSSRVVSRVPDIGGAVDWGAAGEVFVTEGPEDTGLIDIRDARTGESVRSWRGHDIDVNDAVFSPDGSLLGTTGDDGAATVWDPDTGEEVARGTPGPARRASPCSAVGRCAMWTGARTPASWPRAATTAPRPCGGSSTAAPARS